MVMDVFCQEHRNAFPQLGAWKHIDTVNVPDSELLNRDQMASYAWDYAIRKTCERKGMNFDKYSFIAVQKMD